MSDRNIVIAMAWLALGCDADPGHEDGSATDTVMEDEGADDPDGSSDAGEPNPVPSCATEGLDFVTRPVDPDDPYSETFAYFYQHLDRGDEGPTVIVIPGGPGGASIGGDMAAGLPADVDVVLTDPRGVGCNATGAPWPESFYGTSKFASDILAVVRELELDDWIVYGHSYGTVLGTVVAASAEEQDLPPPRTVVLEGIVGPAVQQDKGEYLRLWGKIRDALPPDVHARLAADPPPLGKSPLQWGEFITFMLSQQSGNLLFEALLALGEGGDTKDLAATIDAVSAGPPSWEDEVMMALFTAVACRELAEESWFAFELRGDALDATLDACADQPVTDPYAPADWPITSPIVYFEGSIDPATPPAGARTHFESQTLADRTFVTVDGVGHNPLNWALTSACGTTVWDAILRDEDPKPTLDACGITATVEHAPAQ